MKQFQFYGQLLSKSDQKNIKGGTVPIECDSPAVPYCCDWEYTNGTMDQDTICATSTMNAKAAIINSHSNVWNVQCQLA